MVYINSSEHRKIKILEFHYSESSIFAAYQVYRKYENEIQKLDKGTIVIRDKKIMSNILNEKHKILSPLDCICRGLLQNLIDEKIFLGTIEVENV